MAFRVAAHLPRVAIVALVFVLAGATLTYGAAKRLSATPAKGAVSSATPTVVVPDVTGQAFVFAKGALEDGGFAWRELVTYPTRLAAGLPDWPLTNCSCLRTKGYVHLFALLSTRRPAHRPTLSAGHAPLRDLAGANEELRGRADLRPSRRSALGGGIAPDAGRSWDGD